MHTKPTSYRIIEKYSRNPYISDLNRDEGGFSSVSRNGLKLSRKGLVTILKESGAKGQGVLVISRLNKMDQRSLKATETLKSNIGRALAIIKNENFHTPIPEVRLLIEANTRGQKVPKQMSESIKLKKIDLSPEEIRGRRSNINEAFQSSDPNILHVVINSDSPIGTPPPFLDVNHSTAVVLDNFDKLFRLAA